MIIKQSCAITVLVFSVESDPTSGFPRAAQCNHGHTITTSATPTAKVAVLVRPSGRKVLCGKEIPMMSGPTIQERAMFLRFKHEM